jgi:hypothetical protein
LAAYWALDGAVAGVWPDGHGPHDLAVGPGGTVGVEPGVVAGALSISDTEMWAEGCFLQTAATAALAMGGDFTVSAWIMPELRDWADEPVLRVATSEGVNCFALRTRLMDDMKGVLSFAVGAEGGGDPVVCDGWMPTDAHEWTHCVAVRQAGALTLYRNGEVEATANLPAGFRVLRAMPAGFVQLGGSGAVPNFPGRIDEVAVWQRALGRADVARLYNGGAGLAYADF